MKKFVDCVAALVISLSLTFMILNMFECNSVPKNESSKIINL